MKDNQLIKLIFLAMEVSCIIGAVILIWCGDWLTEDSWVTRVFTTLLVLVAVAMQKEYLYWDYMDDNEEEL